MASVLISRILLTLVCAMVSLFALRLIWTKQVDVFWWLAGRMESALPIKEEPTEQPDTMVGVTFQVSETERPRPEHRLKPRVGREFVVYCFNNSGSAADRNVMIEVRLSKTITSLTTAHQDRMKVIQGGTRSNYVKFLVPELLPRERQEVFVNTKEAAALVNASAWSERIGKIKKMLKGPIIVYPIETRPGSSVAK